MVNKKAKESVRRSFSAAAEGYGRWAGAQRQAAAMLIRMMPITAAKTAIDLGSGTGFMAAEVVKKYRHASLTCLDFAPGMARYCARKFRGANVICADMEKHTPAGRFGVITSGFTLQWARGLKNTVRKWLSRLEPGGVFAVSVPVAGSLKEMTEVFGENAPVMKFPPAHSVIAALPKSAAIHVADIVTYYRDPLEALRSLKKIGASYDRGSRLSAAAMREGLQRYRAFYGSKCPLSYRVMFAVARRKK
jgi:malonyl-ACP O-methyltransferase BioC